MEKQLISIVLPVFNEEAGIQATIDTLLNYVEQQEEDYELVFVNDGSKDKSATIIKNAISQNDNIKLVEFSRNFGHQLAITAGLQYTKGDAVVVMDADLQDPPEVIPQMIEKWHEGYEIVYGKRMQRDGADCNALELAHDHDFARGAAGFRWRRGGAAGKQDQRQGAEDEMTHSVLLKVV